MTAGETGMEVTTRRYFASWMLAAYPPEVQVDDTVYDFQWMQTKFIGLAPGDHDVFVYFPYVFGWKCGKRRVVATVQEGKTLKLKYHAPVVVFMRGRLRQKYA